MKTISFEKIVQPDIRSEIKKAIYQHLSCEAVGTIQRELTSFRDFSGFLKDKFPEVESCQDIDRNVWEAYLIHKMTDGKPGKGNSDTILKLIQIHQVKTSTYTKPISYELAMLLEKSIE